MAELQDLLPYTKKLSILYIEPDDILREKVVTLLRKIFAMVDESSDGYDALNNYKINHHNIVVYDLDTPNSFGLQLLQNLKSGNAQQEVVITAKQVKPEEIVKMVNMGISGYSLKPYKMSEFLSVLQRSAANAYQSLQNSELLERTKKHKLQQEKLIELSDEKEVKYKEQISYERKRIGRLMVRQKELESQVENFNQELENVKLKNDLTGTLSKFALQQDLSKAGSKALIYLNIDHFDLINTIYSMGYGNKVLKECAARIEKYLPSNASLYHITADEFAILIMEPVAQQESLLADQILSLFKEASVVINEHSFDLLFSIGITRGEGAELFVRAKSASKEAKSLGGANVAMFDMNSEYMQTQRNNLFWIKEIKLAMEENRLLTHYQPIINNQDKTTTHYEVLCRLVDTKGEVSDAVKFIEPLRVAGLVSQVTRVVIDKSFKYFANNSFNFSINISREDLQENYLEQFLDYKCDKYQINPNRVYLEIVEDSSLANTQLIITQIKRLRALGFHITVDDFGSEYSIFSRMLRFHADFIKIDHSFVQDLDTNQAHRLVVENIVSFAKKAGIKTVAEHVENEALQEQVNALGVDYSQGYFIGKPAAEISLS